MKSRFARRLVLLAIILTTAWFFGPKPDRPPETPVPPAAIRPPATVAAPSPTRLPTPSPARTATASFSAPVVSTTVATPDAVTYVTPDPTAAVAVDQVRRMLRDYRTLTGENPVGTNAEIMRTLMGDNPRQATLGPPEGQSLNDQGELVDQWGTPIFFHQLSKTLMEIRSAGPDRTLWTEDDIVAR